MAVTYTARARLSTLAARRRVADALVNLIGHMEALDSWMLAYSVNVATGTITITMSKALPREQLEHFGLNDDGVTT